MDAWTLLRYGWNAPRKFMTLHVAPGDIARVVAVAGFEDSRKGSPAVLLGGDWDLSTVPWEERHENELDRILPGVQARVRDGVSWQETGLHDRLERLIARYGSYDRCRSRDDVIRRYAALDALIDFARQNGRLRRRSEIGPSFREFGGIDVVIGREGEVLKSGGGGHRLAVAKVLDLAAIPVCVNLVHPQAVASGRWKALVARSRELEAALSEAVRPSGAGQP